MLEICLLGQFDVRRDGEPLEIPSRPSRLLLAYLVLAPGKRQPREKLAGLLWPDSDEESARGNLRQALWRLRKTIGEGYLLADKRSVAFDAAAGYWLDTAVLQDEPDATLTNALAVYEGELLPGYYEDWVLLERERLQGTFERKMGRLLDGMEQKGQWADILRWAEQWIAFGQTPEPAYRALMLGHAAQGDLSAVAAAYERCVEALQREVGVEPSKETRDLYARLVAGSEAPTPSPANEAALDQKPRHNLPHQSTSFIGRDAELAQIRELLAASRLLTLVGPGGTGKTRLALQAASEQVDSFANGVYFISLAPIDSADLIAQTIAEVIGFPLSSHEDPRRQLLRHLRRRRYLLVLDNFEHLLPGASLVSALLQSAGEVKIIVTSRERLNLQEETLVRIEGMAYPSSPSASDALGFSAVKLFIDSARHVRPDFVPGEEALPHIIHICRLLEGMPLGILMAAAWIELLSPEEIVAEIARSLDFLHAEWRGAPQRHLSVRAVFDSSWQRLTEEQRQLFARLAVFRGGFTRDAAEAVTGATLYDLAMLVNKSLLRRDLQTGRYEMHELLRQYAREHLAASPDGGAAIAEVHAVHYAALIQQLWLKLISSEQLAARVMVDADLDNFRQSWRFWLQRRDAVFIRMYFDPFRMICDLHGWNKTGVELFSEAAAALEPVLASPDEETEVAYAEVLAGQAYFLANLGYADAGLKLAKESIAILLRLERFSDMSTPFDFLQYNAFYIEEREQAIYRELRDQIDFTDDVAGRWKRAYSMTWRGRAAAWRGDPDEGRRRLKESLRMFEQQGDEISTVFPRLELAHLAVLQGAYHEARAELKTVMSVARASGYDWPLVKAARYLGNIATLLGEFPQSRMYLLDSLRLAEELGMIRDQISVLYDLATVEAEAGDKETAVRLLTLVQEHPLSHHTRTFSMFSGDQEVRFQKLAEMHLQRLREEMPHEKYSAAAADGRALELDTAVLEMLNG